MIRYYHYISERAVSEIYAGVDPPLWAGVRSKFGVPGVPVEIDVGELPPAASIEQKAQIAEVALRHEGLLGTIAVPGEWFGGTMSMNWGAYGTRPDGNPRHAFFVGYYADILVALGGRADALRRSGIPVEESPYSNSGWEGMMRALGEEADRVRFGRDPHAVETRAPRPELPHNTGAWPDEAAEILSTFDGPGYEVEFVAKWVESSHPEWHHGEAILGVPLFVAAAQQTGSRPIEPVPPTPVAQSSLHTRLVRKLRRR